MSADPLAPAWERTIRPWHWASAALSFVQVAVFAAALVLAASDVKEALVASAAIVALELPKWLVDRRGLRAVPDVDREALYRAAPLEPAHRTIVAVQLLSLPSTAAVLLVAWPAAGILFLSVGATTVLPLYRVWRRNSWLAISRLPLQPRRR